MKTLIVIGAARKNGYTRQTMDLFLEHLDGEKKIIDTYRTKAKPCVGRRFYQKKKECAIKDGMQEIYQRLGEADNIILASPMYFHSITGGMKSLIGRFQAYWAGHMRNGVPETFLRKDTILIAGSVPSLESQFPGGGVVLRNLLSDLSTECLDQICLPNSDRGNLETRPDITAQIIALAEKISRTVR